MAAALSLGIALIIWSIIPTTPDDSIPVATPAPREETSALRDAVSPPPATETAAVPDGPAPEVPATEIALGQPGETEQAAGIATEAFGVAPTGGEAPELWTGAVLDGPEPLPLLGEVLEPRPEALRGVELVSVAPLSQADLPTPESSDRIELAAIDPVGLATDAVALPAPPAPEEPFSAAPHTDTPAGEVVAALPPTPAETPETDPVAQTPAPDTAADPATVHEPAAEDGDGEVLRPTERARSLPDRAPRARPGGFTEVIERDRFGGRTVAELETIRPGARPQSAQAAALRAIETRSASELAVESSAPPRTKPEDFDAIVATALVRQQTEAQQAALAAQVPDTTAAIEAALAEDLAAEEEAAAASNPRNSPRMAIPSSASVARQATLEDAIRLNRINLVGVYGLSSDRRALVRLPSGRYQKVQVGDEVDGGIVQSISESELRYRKGGRLIALSIPSG